MKHSPIEERKPAAKLVNESAEISLLGALISNPDALDRVTEFIGADDFFAQRNAMVYSAICMAAIENSTGITAVVEQLRKDNSLGEVTEPYVRSLTEHACDDRDLKRNVEIITDLSAKRATIASAQGLMQAVLQGNDEAVALDKLLQSQVKAETKANDFADLEDIATAIVAGNYKRLEPTILRRADGECLLYPQKLNWLAAPPESQKSFVALLACLQEMHLKGKPVVYVDFEDSGETAVERLYKIAVGEQLDDVENLVLNWVAGPKHADGTRDKSKRLFYYMQAGRAFDIRMRSKIIKIINKGAELVVVDGAAVAIALSQLNENDNGDVNKWLAAVSYPITQAGAAVLVIDHVTKNNSPGSNFGNRSPRGAGAKLASVSGAALMAEVKEAGSAFTEGKIEILVAKDRPGRLRCQKRSGKRIAGVLISKPMLEGREGLQLRIHAAEEIAEQAEQRRFDLVAAEHISKLLSDLGPTSKGDIRKMLKERAESKGTKGFRTETTVAAMKFLEDNKYIKLERDGKFELCTSLLEYKSSYGDVHADDVEVSPF